MRRILPVTSEVAKGELNAVDLATGESRPQPPGRPWVLMNVVQSADGHVVANDGRSARLSGPGDRAMFHALRGVADVIFAGATTVRVENYGPARLPEEVQASRARAGRPRLPHLAVASRSLHLNPKARLFREAPSGQPPLILTNAKALEARPHAAAALKPVARFLVAGETSVDWHEALALFSQELGAKVLLLEGGPNTNGQLIAADLVDELCLTISPVLAGGSTPSASSGGLMSHGPNGLRLDRVLEDDGFLLLRYVRPR